MKEYTDYLAEQLDKTISYKEYISENISNNSVESLQNIFKLISDKTYDDFLSMTNDERLEFVRNLKIKNVLDEKNKY